MNSILKRFFLIFVVGILSQSWLENTSWGMEDTNIENIKKLKIKDIWAIIEEIANNTKTQPGLSNKIEDLVNTEMLECKPFKNVTFADFVKNLDGEELLDCLLKNNVIVLGETRENKFTKFDIAEIESYENLREILVKISKNIVGRLLFTRIGIANKIKKEKKIMQVKIQFSNACNINLNLNVISVNQEIADSVCYTTFSNTTGENDSILMHGKKKEAGVDVALFHELVHAFHRINNLNKVIGYNRGCSYSNISSQYDNFNVVNNPLFKTRTMD